MDIIKQEEVWFSTEINPIQSPMCVKQTHRAVILQYSEVSLALVLIRDGGWIRATPLSRAEERPLPHSRAAASPPPNSTPGASTAVKHRACLEGSPHSKQRLHRLHQGILNKAYGLMRNQDGLYCPVLSATQTETTHEWLSHMIKVIIHTRVFFSI